MSRPTTTPPMAPLRAVLRLPTPMLSLAVAGLAVSALPAQGADTAPAAASLHRGARVVVAPGLVLEGDEARIAVRDGAVLAVGREIPAGFERDAEVVDHGESWIVPGFVLPHTDLGQENDLAETVDAFTPDLRAIDAFDPHGEVLALLARNGVTTCGFAPTSRNTVGGLAGVVRLDPTAHRGRVLLETSYLKLALVPASLDQGRYPTSRMGAVDLIRTEFARIRNEVELDPASTILASAAGGERNLVVHADTHAGITSALDLAAGLGVGIVLYGARELDQSLDRLPSETVRGVVLGPVGFGSPERRLGLAAALHEKGVRLAFAAGSPAELRESVALAVRHGLPRAAAWTALTRTPAEFLGVADRVGSLRNGRRADFGIWSGDPVDLTSRLGAVYVDGVPVPPAGSSSAAGASSGPIHGAASSSARTAPGRAR